MTKLEQHILMFLWSISIDSIKSGFTFNGGLFCISTRRHWVWLKHEQIQNQKTL